MIGIGPRVLLYIKPPDLLTAGERLLLSDRLRPLREYVETSPRLPSANSKRYGQHRYKH